MTRATGCLAFVVATLFGCGCPTGDRVMTFEQIGGPVTCDPIDPIPIRVEDGRLQFSRGTTLETVIREVDGGVLCEYLQEGFFLRPASDSGVPEHLVWIRADIVWDSEGEAEFEEVACREVRARRCCGDYRVRISRPE